MNGWCRAMALVIVTSTVCASACNSADACDNSRVEQLYNGELSIELRADWRITRTAPIDGFFTKLKTAVGNFSLSILATMPILTLGPASRRPM